jgi:ketosteroid isomerase-like protein
MTSENDSVEANVALVRRYEETYNTDVERFVTDCYSLDCVVNGGAIRGHEQFLRVEKRVLRTAPRRRMRVERIHPSGDEVVVVEGMILDPEQGEEWKLPFCAVLTCRNGRIVSDWTYAEFAKWPGIGNT